MNPAILGGIIVDFGDKTVDLSVQSRVNKLNNLLQRTSPDLLIWYHTLMRLPSRIRMSYDICYIEERRHWC